MQAMFAIARLTLKAAFRFRLVPVLLVALVGGVLLLPAVIKDDGTARGLTQIVLTYNLGLIAAVLGLTTLWLACGTLARDIEECQIQVVAVKPVARWQIWLGKWLGIMLLNALMLGVSGASVYAQLLGRAHRLPPPQREVLQNEVLVGRGSFKEVLPDLGPSVDRLMQEKLKANPALGQMPRAELRRVLREDIKRVLQMVPPGITRIWRIDLGHAAASLRDRPLYLRVKFFAADRPPESIGHPSTYTGVWDIGPPESAKRVRTVRSQAAETFHEFAIPPNLFDDHGVLTVEFSNTNETGLWFPLDEGFEVLYRESGFALNYARGLGILFCWLALLAAIGLAGASFLSFPVAAFLALGLLIVAFSTGTMKTIIEQGTIREVNHDTGMVDKSTLFDQASVATFQGLLGLVNLVKGFSPVDALSTGRSITWTELARAVAQVVVFMGGGFATAGILIFTRRELATAQGHG